MFVYVVKKDTFACTASTCLVLRQRARQRASAVQACRTTNQKNISGHTQQSNAMWPEAWVTTLVSMLAMGGSLSLPRSVQRRVRDPRLGVLYHLQLQVTRLKLPFAAYILLTSVVSVTLASRPATVSSMPNAVGQTRRRCQGRC